MLLYHSFFYIIISLFLIKNDYIFKKSVQRYLSTYRSNKMAKKQFYGIKYPFTDNGMENYFLDVNYDTKDKVKSLLMHVVFTPKGQKIRDPEFGTNLIKYIFEPNDSVTWEGIKSEISEVVKRYIKGVTINNISLLERDESGDHEIYVRLDYSVVNGFKIVNDSLVTKI